MDASSAPNASILICMMLTSITPPVCLRAWTRCGRHQTNKKGSLCIISDWKGVQKLDAIIDARISGTMNVRHMLQPYCFGKKQRIYLRNRKHALGQSKHWRMRTLLETEHTHPVIACVLLLPRVERLSSLEVGRYRA